MFNRFISGYVINKLTEEVKPKVNNKRCLNRLQKRQECRLCISSCNKEAIKINNGIEIDGDKCDNCTICSVVCKTGAIIPRREVVEKQCSIISGHDNLLVGCINSNEVLDLNVDSLDRLPWELLAYIAVNKKCYLLMNSCEVCTNIRCKNIFKETLERLKIFLGKDIYHSQIIFIKDPKKIPKKEMSRRDFFKFLGGESKKMFGDIIPIDFEENRNPRIYRSLLLEKLKESDKKYCWNSININENCYGCGLCEKLCPQKAINIDKNENDERFIVHDFRKCTHCGLCTLICLNKSIELVDSEKFIDDVFIKKVKSISCSICGDPIEDNDNGTCIVCKQKRRM